MVTQNTRQLRIQKMARSYPKTSQSRTVLLLF